MDSIELRTWAVRGKRSLICLVNIESYIMVKDAVKVHTNDNPKVKIRRGIVKKLRNFCPLSDNFLSKKINTHMSLL